MHIRDDVTHTLPRHVATRDWATVEKVPKMAMVKSTICFTIVCAASATGPRAAQYQRGGKIHLCAFVPQSEEVETIYDF